MIIVLLISKIQFWSSVVSGGNILGEVVVFIDLISENIRLSKVTDLDFPVVIYKNVERLQISVNYAFLMKVKNSFHDFK